jgi:aromatic-L-amino-acid/L-tryptophan decarboxylase
MSESPHPQLGDMPADEFRRHAHELVEWVAGYIEEIESYPVLSRVVPGAIRERAGDHPAHGETEMGRILEDFRKDVLPGITHWNHPSFFAYFGISASAPGILGEMLIAALNVNGMLWRTSPAATELEEVATEWLRDLLGLPPTFSGHIQDTASTSTMVAIAAAREATGLEIRERGLPGREIPQLRIYCSEEAHSSVEKAAITLGIGRAGTVRIPTDESFRMRPALLRQAIERDLQSGARPICIVATLGTTSTTSIDPIPEIAEICRTFGLWLHVDAAYAGAAAVVPELRHLHQGWELADSIVVNPHKWLFVPIDCSTLFVRDPLAIKRAFSLTPEYLTTPEGESVTNLMEFGPALGRRFRALKLWITLRYFGGEGLAARIGEHVRLGRLLAGWIEREDRWKLMAPVPFSTVCFRFEPGSASEDEADRLNEAILHGLNQSGTAYLSHTRLHGRYTLRLAIGNIRSEERHVRSAWDTLRRAADDLLTNRPVPGG